MGPPNLKKMLQVKIKPRQDSYSDQFSRILMVKVLMLTAAITGISWMKDKVTCIVPKNHDASPGFISKACWINGFYVYRDIPAVDQSYYYGIPTDILYDGINKYGVLCESNSQSGKANSNCDPLEKTFFLQYQWFPIIIAAIGYIYYLPYLLFRLVNKDMQDLKDTIKGKAVDDVNYDAICNKFFTREDTSVTTLHVRVMLNVVVKVLYVVANVLGMIFVDSALNNEFMEYGSGWSTWLGLSNEKMHDYTDPTVNKPGHQLLPGFGLCQVLTSAKDLKNTVINTHTYICELSQHVLYQYILIVLWYMFIFGIVVSILGLAKHVFSKIFSICNYDGENEEVKRIYSRLTTREKEYLDFVRRKNMPVYGGILRKLRENGDDPSTSSGSSRSLSRSSYSPNVPEKEALMMS